MSLFDRISEGRRFILRGCKAIGTGRVRDILKNTLLCLFSVIFSLIVAEGLFRLWEGRPVFELRDYRSAGAKRINISRAARYDRDLGWVMKSNITVPTLSTLDYGVRRNDTGDTLLRTGGVLVVGDSFAAGSEVSDAESWPAFLERKLGRSVINGGVGGYGTDQIIMRAEQLLPIVNPKILLVDFLSQDILRAGYSNYGQPKPYYTVRADKLVLHNSPAPYQSHAEGRRWLENILGYSLILDRVMAARDAASWYAPPRHIFRRIQNDEVDVTCRLLKRLKTKTDELGVRTLLILQHGGFIVRDEKQPLGYARLVIDCAREIGIQVVDEFSTLKAIYRKNPEDLKKYYVMRPDGRYGHMSAQGNELIASLIEKALAQPPVKGSVQRHKAEQIVPGDGNNLLAKAESSGKLVAGTAFARFSAIGDREKEPPSYGLTADGERAQHYVSLNAVSAGPGYYAFSVSVKNEGTDYVRLQLLDEKQNGILADFDLDRQTVATTRSKLATQLRAGVEPAKDGWYRLWLSAKLPKKDPRVLIQLAGSNGRLDFEPSGEAIRIRAVQLERGQAPSSYHLISSKKD